MELDSGLDYPLPSWNRSSRTQAFQPPNLACQRSAQNRPREHLNLGAMSKKIYRGTLHPLVRWRPKICYSMSHSSFGPILHKVPTTSSDLSLPRLSALIRVMPGKYPKRTALFQILLYSPFQRLLEVPLECLNQHHRGTSDDKLAFICCLNASE